MLSHNLKRFSQAKSACFLIQTMSCTLRQSLSSETEGGIPTGQSTQRHVWPALSQMMRTSTFCRLIIDLHSHLWRWSKFSFPSFQENADHTEFSLLNPPGQNTIIPFLQVKPLSWFVSARKKKGKDKSGASQEQNFQESCGLRVFY